MSAQILHVSGFAPAHRSLRDVFAGMIATVKGATARRNDDFALQAWQMTDLGFNDVNLPINGSGETSAQRAVRLGAADQASLAALSYKF